MGEVSGRHAGKRRAVNAASRLAPRTAMGLAIGLIAAIVAWGYLSWLAIDFGTTARGGSEAAWWLLGLAGIGAIACLFVALMILTRLVTALGLLPEEGSPARVAGGRRRAG